MVQVGQMVLDHYTAVPELSLLDTPAPIVQANKLVEVLVVVAAICDIWAANKGDDSSVGIEGLSM